VYKRVQGAYPLMREDRIIESAGGDVMEALGKVVIPIKIGGKWVAQMFTVLKQVNHSVLLGRDFLVKNQIIVNYGAHKLKIGRKWVDMVEDKYVSYIARTECEVVLKPQTVNIIKARIRDKGYYSLGQTLRVRELSNQEVDDEPWLKVVNGIVCLEPKRSVPTMVLNHTSKTRKLEKGSMIAEVVEGEVEIEDEDMGVTRGNINTISNWDSVHDCRGPGSGRAMKPRSLLTRERREQMIEQVVAPDEMKIRVEQFVIKNHEVFALHDTELGRTDTVVMDIDTGKATPIHSRPYRAALMDRDIMERALDDMLQARVIRTVNSA
jgi:hypothetical protein